MVLDVGRLLPLCSSQRHAGEGCRRRDLGLYRRKQPHRTRACAEASCLMDPDAAIDYTDASGRRVQLSLRTRDIMVRSGEHCCSYLDAQGRPVLVAVLQRYAGMPRGPDVCLKEERLSGCSDDELLELFEIGLEEGVIDMRLNAGSFQNLRHLHLKLRMEGLWLKVRPLRCLEAASSRRNGLIIQLIRCCGTRGRGEMGGVRWSRRVAEVGGTGALMAEDARRELKAPVGMCVWVEEPTRRMPPR